MRVDLVKPHHVTYKYGNFIDNKIVRIILNVKCDLLAFLLLLLHFRKWDQTLNIVIVFFFFNKSFLYKVLARAF